MEIANYLEQVSNDHLSTNTKQKIYQMMREIGELESIGDACYNLSRTLNRSRQLGMKLTAEQIIKLNEMMGLCDEALEQMCKMMHSKRIDLDIRETYRIENEIDQMRDRLKLANIDSVNNRQYEYALGSIFSDLIAELEKMGDYIVNVVQARIGK